MSARMTDEAGKDTREGESTREPSVPRTERSYWQAITDALNDALDGGMPVGIDLDGTLTDHRAWSVVWDRAARRWALTGYAGDEEPQSGDGEALTVYRASHDSVVMGLYTTRQAAYEHCEAYELRDDPVSPMSWTVDEDGVAELVRLRVPRSPGAESATGYVVTPLTVASAYDEDADE